MTYPHMVCKARTIQNSRNLFEAAGGIGWLVCSHTQANEDLSPWLGKACTRDRKLRLQHACSGCEGAQIAEIHPEPRIGYRIMVLKLIGNRGKPKPGLHLALILLFLIMARLK